MKYAREFHGKDRGEALTAILIELPAVVLSNFEFDDETQVASFDADADLVSDYDGLEVDVIDDGEPEVDEFPVEILPDDAAPLNDAPPTRRGLLSFIAGLFEKKGDT